MQPEAFWFDDLDAENEVIRGDVLRGNEHKIPEPYGAEKVTSVKVFDATKKRIACTKIKTKEGVDIKVTKGKPALLVLTTHLVTGKPVTVSQV